MRRAQRHERSASMHVMMKREETHETRVFMGVEFL